MTRGFTMAGVPTLPAFTNSMAAMALSVLAACATLPSDYPKAASFALEDTGDTELGRRVSKRARSLPPNESGFYVITEGVDALAGRLLLADRAERSIDAQYYIVEGDLVGTLFIERLLSAADRGVRVRLLMDDHYTIGDDAAIAALDSHPNFELRIFNPFAHRSKARMTEFVTNLDRVDHRMHNKSFTVDNQISIVGGRNIASEYFDARQDLEFNDMDVATFGPTVKEVSRAFDIYWNSEFAFPAGVLVEEEGGPEALRAVRQRHARTIQAEAAQTYASGLRTSMLQNMMDPRFPLFTGKATVVYDDPAKVEKPEEVTTIQSLLRERVHSTRSELMVVSPYFVLLDDGLETFRKLRDRGVRIVVLTNSLASTDVVPVHSGYSKAREVLLEAGVEIHEIKPDVSFDEMGKSGIDFTHSALHMKSFIIDRKSIFFGSFNWDPRSAKINTEIGIFVDSTALAEWAAELLTKRLRTNSYLVRLDADEEIEWVDLAGDEPVVYTKEPKTGGWRRFQAWFFGLLPIEQEL